MEVTEQMVAYVAQEVNGSTVIEFDGKTIELGGTWQRLTMREAIKKWAEIDYVDYPDADRAARRDPCDGWSTRPKMPRGAS